MANETKSSSQHQHNTLATEDTEQAVTMEKQEQHPMPNAIALSNATENPEKKQQSDPEPSLEQQSMTESCIQKCPENPETNVKSEQPKQDDGKEKLVRSGSADKSEDPNTSQKDDPQSKKNSSKRLRYGPSQRNKSGPKAKNGSYRNYYKRRYNGIHGDDRLPFIRDAVKLQGKNISLLDIGCNDGTVTIEMASLDRCVNAVGVDIDPNLVGAARKKLREFVDKEASKSAAELAKPNIQGPVPKSNDAFPLSLRRSLDLMKQAKEQKEDETATGTEKELVEKDEFAKPDTQNPSLELYSDAVRLLHRAFRVEKVKKNKKGESASVKTFPRFPYNVTFRREDFAQKEPTRTSQEVGKYDVVMCLSVTKWVHFAGGDEGLKRLFRRLHACLKPGGVLILEPQPQKSYKSALRKGLGKKDFKGERKLLPPKFPEYLIKTVGFTKMRMLRDVRHRGQAFNRPIMVFYKQKEQEMPPSRICFALSNHADAFLGVVPSDNEEDGHQPEQGAVAEGQDGHEEQQDPVQNEMVEENVDGSAAQAAKEEGQEKEANDDGPGERDDEASGERERQGNDGKELESGPQATSAGPSNAEDDASALVDDRAPEAKENEEDQLANVAKAPSPKGSDSQVPALPALPSSGSKPRIVGQDVEAIEAQSSKSSRQDQEEKQLDQTDQEKAGTGVKVSSSKRCEGLPSSGSKRRSTDQGVEGTEAHSPKRSKRDQDEKDNEPKSPPQGPSN